MPRRQQQIENRVRQISPREPASEQKPTPATEEKSTETPAPAVTEKKTAETPTPAVTEKKTAETPAPAATEKKAQETPAQASEEKAEEKSAPIANDKAQKTPGKKNKKGSSFPTVKENDVEKPNSEASIIKEETNVPEVPEKKEPAPENEVPDFEEDPSANAPEVSSDPLHEEAVGKVLNDPNVPEEAKTALKHATKEDIQKTVEEATAEVEADNQNKHIDGVVENSRKEVDEDSIESAVNEVLDSSEETLMEEQKRSESLNEDEDVDDSVPDSVNQIIQEIETGNDEKAEETPDLDEDDAEEDETEAPSDAKIVKQENLDQELKIPENATFEELHAFLIGLDSIVPADLEQTNQEVMMDQAKKFLEKVFQAKLDASNQMLALEDLTDEQWREAVSWKVQSLANLFQLDTTRINEMREFVDEVRPKAPKDVLWKLESILIQMEWAQIPEKPESEELKEFANRMIEHTQKGINENCINLDFVFATFQLVLMTEESLPQEESKVIFESAIKTLDSSEMPKLKEMAKLLQKILNQREIVGQTPDLTLQTYDGKTVKTSDYVGKTVLIYCFQISSRDQLQDLGIVYQLYLAFHSRGLEVIGIVPEEKTDAMDALLKQIPWPMVFEGNNAETSVFEKLCVPSFPVKVLVNAEGKIEKVNIQSMALLKYLESVYGSVSKTSDDEEAEEEADAEAEEAGTEEETDELDPPADEADEMPDADAEEDEETGDAEAEEAGEDEAIEPPADDAKEAPAEKAKEKADELDLDLDSLL